MCHKESSQDSKGSGNQMSELTRSVCCPENLEIRTQFLHPSDIFKHLKGCPGAGSVAFSERVALEHKLGPGQIQEAVELREMQVSAQDLTTGKPSSGLPHRVCALPEAVWVVSGARWQGDSRSSGDLVILRSGLPALDSFDLALWSVCASIEQREDFSSRETSLPLK